MRLFVRLVLFFFIRIFNIKGKVPPEVKKLKAPYLVLGNHAGYWDPFVVGCFLKPFTHFVSSDAAFRNKFQRFFLVRLGTIPKKKNIRDTKVIRDIVSVIRQGENVGIFPSGVRTWAGVSLPFDRSIVKLIRLLQVPVVVAVLKGMMLFNPRWSRKLRHTKVEAGYKLLFTREQINNLSDDELFEQLNQNMFHNEIEYQRSRMNRIVSKHQAEFVNHALYVCPECHAIDSFGANGNDFGCTECGYDIHINEYGFYERKSKGMLHFDNILDWYNWEEKWMLDFIKDKYEKNFKGIIFSDKNSSVYHSASSEDLDFIGVANVYLYIDRIEIIFNTENKTITMNFNDLQTLNPQVNEMMEIFYNGEAYRIIGGRDGVSALKWEVAVNVIWNKTRQFNKLSSYIQQK